ncbi:MAG: MMPL family transporter [Lachnospiraceae bacterium]|nr:MMPL family transporter [Lachnospiraceae bacterium]
MKKTAEFIVDKRKFIIFLYVLFVVISVIGILMVNVNYDMSKYLPKDSKTKLGMEQMSEEFGDLAGITVMFDDLHEAEQMKIKEDLAAISNVKSVIYIPDDENYQKNNHSKYMVTVSAGTYSEEAETVLDEIREKYKDASVMVSGAVVDNDLLVTTLMDEIPGIAIIVVVIIFIILFLLCDSWVEPFIYMGCIGVAILINMGTNALLPSVSFMTFAVGALLQLGLSMDYSIMLMNRYNQEKLEDPKPAAAMKRALVNAFGAITSSSVTTIVGLIVLVFMSFKIGQDMGIVLAKGVFISLICIFTLLPGLVIICDKAIMKTHKKSLNINMNRVMQLVVKVKFVLIPAAAVIVVLAVVIKGGLGISFIKMFENEDQQKIEAAFGVDNQIVVLYDNSEDRSRLDSYIAWLEGQKPVNSVQDYSNTIGKEYTYTELAQEMNIDTEQAKMLYQLYSGNPAEETKISLEEFLRFIKEDILTNDTYSSAISEEMKQMVSEGWREIQENRDMLLGKRYNRMMVSVSLPLESKDTFQLIGEMSQKADVVFAKDTYLVGDSTMGYEMDLGFSDELNFITILTVVAIFLVVLATFRSVLSSVVLVAVIQSAVFIITAIISAMGITVNYIALILVQCILMGSTIDYGILFISNYKEVRQEKEKREAIGIAMNHSIHTILTSSLILISCCLTVGCIMTQKVIAQTCSVIAYGTVCAVIMVIFVLPALTYVLDSRMIKKAKKEDY